MTTASQLLQEPQTSYTQRHAIAWAMLATLLATCVVYWPGLSGPMVLDDGINLAPLNDWLQGLTGWWSVVVDNGSGPLGRPVSMASFVLNLALIDQGSWGLKLGNLVIHLANGLLIYALCARLLALGALTRDSPREIRWPAWLAATIWLLHPLLVSTVLYVVQRMAMLSALFMLLAMLAYLDGRVALRESNRRKAVLLLGLTVPLCTVLAAFSKENGILAPSLCAVLECLVFMPVRGTQRHRTSSGFIGLFLVLPAVIALVLAVWQPAIIADGYVYRDFSLYERLLTQARVLWSYVGSLFLPINPALGLYHDDFTLSHGLLAPATTLLAILAWLGAGFAAWRLRYLVPGFALGLGIFLVGQSLESSIFPLMLYFEHRNYLPIIGMIWAVLSLAAIPVQRLQTRLDHPRRIGMAIAGVILVALATGTTLQAQVWTSEQRLLAQALISHPESPSAHSGAIVSYLRQQPPAFELAREQTSAMRESRRAPIRRTGMAMRALVDCSANNRVDTSLVDAMFDGTPIVFGSELTFAFEMLSDRVAAHACTGLAPARMADGLKDVLDRWEQAKGLYAGWRLHFRAASLYNLADRHDAAIAQARLTNKGQPLPQNVSVGLIHIFMQNGNLPDASHTLAVLQQQLRPSDYHAHQVVRELGEMINAAQRHRDPTP